MCSALRRMGHRESQSSLLYLVNVLPTPYMLLPALNWLSQYVRDLNSAFDISTDNSSARCKNAVLRLLTMTMNVRDCSFVVCISL